MYKDLIGNVWIVIEGIGLKNIGHKRIEEDYIGKN